MFRPFSPYWVMRKVRLWPTRASGSSTRRTINLGIGAEGPDSSGQLHLETTLDFLFNGSFHRNPGGKGLFQMGMPGPAPPSLVVKSISLRWAERK